MFRSISVLLVVCAFILSGCATPGKSTLLGAAIGSTAGAGVGVLAGQGSSPGMRTQSAIIGLGIGGLLGVLIGHESYKPEAKKDDAQGFDANAAHLEMFGAAPNNDKRPTLKPAQVKVHYVEDQIKDGTFIPAHFEYLISDPAHWENSK